MVVFGVILSIVLMGVMIYMAVDKKSTFPTRLASLGSLAIMIIASIVCIFIILSDNTVPVDPSTLIVGAPVETTEEHHNVLALIFTVLFFLVLFIVILYLAIREHKRSLAKNKNNVLSI